MAGAASSRVSPRLPFRRGRAIALFVVAVLVCTLAAVVSQAAPAAAAVPSGFVEVTAFSGLEDPTAVRFAPDGRVFVIERRGTVLMFSGLDDPTPSRIADLRTEVHNFYDRGLLGLAVDPGFPTRPYLYVLYTFDGPIGGTAPRWGDTCPQPPGANADGCVVSGKLARLTLNPDGTTTKKDLIHDWCQQYPSHSVGDLVFGPDGALYVSAGEGAAYTFTDYGQRGRPLNPCGDPPGGVGGRMTPPTAQGGSLRSQDLRTPADRVTLDGTVIRVDPATGAAAAGNPNAAAQDPNARRIVAYGLRNPFRMTARPGAGDIWVGDVGAGSWEELNRIPTSASAVRNFGWPCYEGAGRQSAFDATGLTLCEDLYASAGAHTRPYFAYRHGRPLNGADDCGFAAGSSSSGVAFGPPGGAYPARYNGALYFADYSRRCIWVISRGADGRLDPAGARPFVAGAAGPVDLEFSPTGELFYVDTGGGTIRRVVHRPTSCPAGQYLAQYFPNRKLTGSPAATKCEPGPLNHSFGTSAPPGIGPDDFSARWSGTFDVATAGDHVFRAFASDGIRVWVDGALLIDQWRDQPRTTFTATRALSAGPHEVRVEWYEATGEAAAGLSWSVVGAEALPRPQIATPTVGTTWKVGDRISFTGSATDPQDGRLPPSALSWQVVLQHCPKGCHAHTVTSLTGAGGSFAAEDHEYPAHLELRLTATDSDGRRATVTRRLDPRTVPVTLTSRPSGLQLALGSRTAATPFTSTVIVGSRQTVSAPSPQTLTGGSYAFQRWSDGGARSHEVTAPATAMRLTAVSYAAACPAGAYKAEYFANRTLTAPARTVVCEAAPLARWWGAGGPPGMAVGADDFSVRWTGTFPFPGGSETFTATHNNGMRVWLDDVAVLDRWSVSGTAGTTRSVRAGSHTVRVQYWEGTGEATAALDW